MAGECRYLSMDSRVVSGTDTQLELDSLSRSRRLIVSGLALLAVWWWSVPAVPSSFWIWRILVSAVFLAGVPAAAALIAAGWSGLAGRSARWPVGVGFLLGMSATIWFVLVYRFHGARLMYVVGSFVFFLAVAVAFFGPPMSKRVRVGTPRAPGTPYPGAEPTASAHEPRTPAFGVRAGSSMTDRWKDRSAGSVGTKVKVPVKLVASIATVVLGALMLLPFLMLVPDTIINRDRGCIVYAESVGLDGTNSDPGNRVDFDVENGCAQTIFDGDGNPAPAWAYEGTSVPYPGPRPPAYTVAAALASWFAMTSLVLLTGIRGISSTRDPDRERMERLPSRRHRHALLAGGLVSLSVSFLATTGAFLTLRTAELSHTWNVLRLPWGVMIGVLISAAVGMLFAASAVVRRTPVVRAFGVGTAVGVGELVLMIYVFTAVLGSAYAFRVTPKTPSVVGTVVLDVWFFVGVLVTIGLTVGWVAAGRGWHVWRRGVAGILGAVVLTVLIGGAGWIPFRYGQAPSWPPKCSEWEVASSAAPSWVPSMPVEVLPPGIRCSSDG